MTPLRGVDFTVRPDVTGEAIDSIVDTATEQGFVEQDSAAANATLSSSGSEWRIRHLLISDTQRSWINGIVNDVFSPFTRFRQALSPTMLVIATRTTAEGTQITVAPLESSRGNPDASNAAGPRVKAIIDAFRQEFGSAIVSESKPYWFSRDTTAPMAPRVFRRLTGWK